MPTSDNIMNEDYNYPTPNESGLINLFSWPNIMFFDHFGLAAISVLLKAMYGK